MVIFTPRPFYSFSRSSKWSASLRFPHHNPIGISHLYPHGFLRLRPKYRLSALFSNILSLYSSLNVRDQVSQSCEKNTKLDLCIYYDLYVYR
jgi:hypothetical protein